jgi:hypothetical protein
LTYRGWSERYGAQAMSKAHAEIERRQAQDKLVALYPAA